MEYLKDDIDPEISVPIDTADNILDLEPKRWDGKSTSEIIEEKKEAERLEMLDHYDDALDTLELYTMHTDTKQ